MELGRPILADIFRANFSWVDFFAVMGLAFLLYLLVHCLFFSESDVRGAIKEMFGRYTPPQGPPGRPIDTTLLAPRLKQLRQHFATETSPHRPSFKKTRLVENKREQLSRLAFFKTEQTEDSPPKV